MDRQKEDKYSKQGKIASAKAGSGRSSMCTNFLGNFVLGGVVDNERADL